MVDREIMDFLKYNHDMQSYVEKKMIESGYVDKRIHDLYQEELEHLTEERKYVIDELIEVRFWGDLSENAEYLALKEQKYYLEYRIDNLQNFLANTKILTDQEGEEMRAQLCEEYIQRKNEIYQNVKNTSISDIANSVVYHSGLTCFGREDMGMFSVTLKELLEKGSFHVENRTTFDTFLVFTPDKEWNDRVCKLVDELIGRMAYLHAYYVLKEAKKVAQKREGVWDEKMESWLQKMETGYFYNSAGVFVGKSEHQLDGDTTYFRYNEDGICVEILEHHSIHEWADEDVEYEVFSTVCF